MVDFRIIHINIFYMRKKLFNETDLVLNFKRKSEPLSKQRGFFGSDEVNKRRNKKTGEK